MFSISIANYWSHFQCYSYSGRMNHLNSRLLVALLDLAQSDLPASVQALAVSLGITRREAANALSDLDRQGLIRAETMRLTFLGLAYAARLRQSRPVRTVAAA